MSDSESEHTARSQIAILSPLEADRDKKRLSGPKYEPAEVQRVVIHMPPFWPNMPNVWFKHIENQFKDAGVTDDSIKYNYIVGNLDLQFLKEVEDVVVCPPAVNRYETLKTELVQRISASQVRKVKQLLMHEKQGDRKPSEFLRHLQGLAGSTVPEDFVRTIWCCQLPTSIQPLLASQSHSLETLGELADCVQEIVAPASHTAATSAAGPSVSELAAEIAELKRAVKDLTLHMRESRPRNRSHSRSRDVQRPARLRSAARTQSLYQKQPVCDYHMMYGDKARRCVRPCDYRYGNAAGDD